MSLFHKMAAIYSFQLSRRLFYFLCCILFLFCFVLFLYLFLFFVGIFFGGGGVCFLLFAFFVFLIFDCFLLLFCLSSFCILCPMLPMYRNLSILALIAPSDFSNVYSSSSPVSLPIPFCCDTY